MHTAIGGLDCATSALIADRAYDSSLLRAQFDAAGIEPVIPPRKNVKPLVPPDMHAFSCRHLVEKVIADLKQFRGIATRSQQHLHTWTALVALCAFVVNTRPTRRGPSPYR